MCGRVKHCSQVWSLSTAPTLSLVKWRCEMVSLATLLPASVLWKLSEMMTVLPESSPRNIRRPLGPAQYCHLYSVFSNIHPAGCLRSLWCSPHAGSPACTRRGWCRPSPPCQDWSWTDSFNMGLAMVTNDVTICIHLASSRAALIPSRVTLYFCLTSIFIRLSEFELKFCVWQHISLTIRMNIRMLLTMLDILID